MVAVSNSRKHIVLVVPAERINHVTNLLDLWLMDKSKEHIAIAINKAHLTFRSHLDLVKLHLNNLSCVLNSLRSRLARNDIKHSYNFG